MAKNKINIKPENKGKFTNWANSKGMSVIEAANRVMANTKNYSPTIVKRANFAKNASKWNKKRYGGDIVSTMGYRDDSPFRNSESLNIYSPEGYIDMSNVGKPIMANGQRLEPYSGLNQVPPSSSGYVKETPMMSKYGGNIYKSGGGYTVTKSNDRKGKTHKVTRKSDGKTEYYGYPGMGEKENSKLGKKAFRSRHAKNLKNNSFFRAYANSTWQNGGSVPIIPMYYEDSGTPIYRDTTDAPPNVYQNGKGMHTVQSGETFLGIGNRYNITPETLTTANPGIDINKLSLNQNINIPDNAGYGMPQGIFQQYSSTPSIAPRINQTIKAAPVQTSLSSIVTPEFLDHLRLREGAKLDNQDRHISYYDSEDRLTGGIGHLMSAKERAIYPKGTVIPKKLVSSWLLKDSKKAYTAALKQAKELGIDNQDFLNSLASVNYQLGTGWKDKFKKTWNYLKEGEFEKASIEAADSKWNTQTPKRVKDFQEGIGNLYKYGGSTKNYANVYDKGGKMGNIPMEARLDKYMTQYGITNPNIKAAAMGIIMAEGQMEGVSEDMYYTTPGRLAEVWSTFSTYKDPKTGKIKRAPKGKGSKYTNALAESGKYVKNPQALGNFIYGNRLGNEGRNTEDGFTFRGRGLNQLTGRGSYKKMGKKLGIDLENNPTWLNTNPDLQAHVAVRFLHDRIAEELPKLVKGSSQFKKRFGKYLDFNNIDNLKDASFLITSANAGFGNYPHQDAFNKRLKNAKNYALKSKDPDYIASLNIDFSTTSENFTQPVQSTETFAPLQATEIINKQKDNTLEFKRKANVDMLENFNVNNIINQNAIDINIPNDVALDQKNSYIDKLNTSMPGPKNIPRFGQAQLFK